MRGSGAFLISLALGLAVSAPAQARKGPMRSFADPSTIFAAEIALNRLAREKGQWKALRETAAEDAVMFVPEKVAARDWLKGRAEPSEPIRRQARRVYLSCDRRTAAATGTWQGPGTEGGRFTTIWRIDDKGRWKWVLDHRGGPDAAGEESEFLEGHVARCRKGGRGPGGPGGEMSPDDSLRWSLEAREDGGAVLRVSLWTGNAHEVVIDDPVAAATR